MTCKLFVVVVWGFLIVLTGILGFNNLTVRPEEINLLVVFIGSSVPYRTFLRATGSLTQKLMRKAH